MIDFFIIKSHLKIFCKHCLKKVPTVNSAFYCQFLRQNSIYLLKDPCVCVCMYVCIYLPKQTFIVSQLFSVARHAEHFKLGSKPSYLYTSLVSCHSAISATYVTSGIITHFVLGFGCLHFVLSDTRVFNLLGGLMFNLIGSNISI